jgi:hypothetical protein
MVLVMMAEKGGNKIIAIVTICIILISIGLSGCVEDDGNGENNDKDMELNYCKYIIEANPESKGFYFLNIPFLIHDKNISFELFDLIKIKEGNGTYQLIETKYGTALNITSDEKIKLLIELSTSKEITSISLSLKFQDKEYIVEYYINTYKNESIQKIDINLNLDYKPMKGAPREKQEIQGTLENNGWTIINGYKEKVTP